MLTISLMLVLSACNSESPMQSNNSHQELKVLKFRDAAPLTLHKKANIKKNITVQEGGSLALQHGTADGAAANFVYANVSLDVLPGALSADAEIGLELETTELQGGVALTFEPHSVVFSQPAVLNLIAHGLDFSGIDPDAVDIFYDDAETGMWIPMQRDNVIVDAELGTVQVINALLPHFSRYAIGLP